MLEAPKVTKDTKFECFMNLYERPGALKEFGQQIMIQVEVKAKQEPAPIIVAAPDRAPQKPASPLKNNKNNVDEDANLTKYMSNLYDEDGEYVEKNLEKLTELFTMGFDNPFLNIILMKKFQAKV